MSDKITIAIDASELTNAQECSFKWHAVHEMGLRLRNEPSYFDKGSLLHYLLERYYLRRRDTSDLQQKIIEECVEEGKRKAVTDFEIDPSEVTAIVFQFREYCRYYEDETWIPLHIEEPFMKEFYEDEEVKIYLTGKPDLIFKYAGTGLIAVTDHKKVDRNSKMSPLRNQFMLYCFALGIDTFVINKVGFQKTLKVEARMQRQTFAYHQELLDEWREDTIRSVKELLIRRESEIYPRNRTACEKYGLCSFHTYCCTRPEAREFLIGTEYTIGEPWDVTKKFETKKD